MLSNDLLNSFWNSFLIAPSSADYFASSPRVLVAHKIKLDFFLLAPFFCGGRFSTVVCLSSSPSFHANNQKRLLARHKWRSDIKNESLSFENMLEVCCAFFRSLLCPRAARRFFLWAHFANTIRYAAAFCCAICVLPQGWRKRSWRVNGSERDRRGKMNFWVEASHQNILAIVKLRRVSSNAFGCSRVWGCFESAHPRRFDGCFKLRFPICHPVGDVRRNNRQAFQWIIDSISVFFALPFLPLPLALFRRTFFFDNHRQVHVAQDRSEKGKLKTWFFALRSMAGCTQVITATECFVSDSWEFRARRRFVSCRFVNSTSLASISAKAALRKKRPGCQPRSRLQLVLSPTSRWDLATRAQ